jgi:hypothetical protein
MPKVRGPMFANIFLSLHNRSLTMPTTKLNDNNRRVHAAKVLALSSKKNKAEGGALSSQFRIIRSDVLKLRRDLAHGYDLLKEFIETKISRRTLIKSK